MNYIGQIIEFIQRFFIWWVSIMPWERAVHVRLGKHMKVLEEGVHLRIPFIDRVYVQTTRLRVIQMPPQTCTTKDGKAVTLVLSLGYSITDILKLYQTLYHAEETLCNIMQARVADSLALMYMEECRASNIEAELDGAMDNLDYGVKFEYCKIVSFAQVKVLRLIQEGHWLPSALTTDKAKA